MNSIENLTQIIFRNETNRQNVLQAWNQISGVINSNETYKMNTLISAFLSEENITLAKRIVSAFTPALPISVFIPQLSADVLNEIDTHWSTYEKLIKALNLEKVDVKGFVSKAKTNYNEITIADLFLYMNIKVEYIFKVKTAIQNALNNKNYTIQQFFKDICVDPKQLDELIAALQEPFGKNMIGLKTIFDIISPAVELIPMFIRDVLINQKSELNYNLGNIIDLVNVIDVNLTTRVNYAIEFADSYQKEVFGKSAVPFFRDLNLEPVSQTLKNIKTNGIQITQFLTSVIGKEPTDFIIKTLIGIFKGNYTIEKTTEEILNFIAYAPALNGYKYIIDFAEFNANQETKLSDYVKHVAKINPNITDVYNNYIVQLATILVDPTIPFYYWDTTDYNYTQEWNNFQNEVRSGMDTESKTYQTPNSIVDTFDNIIEYINVNTNTKDFFFNDTYTDELPPALDTLSEFFKLFDFSILPPDMKATCEEYINKFDTLAAAIKENKPVAEFFDVFGLRNTYERSTELFEYLKGPVKDSYFASLYTTMNNIINLEIPSVININNAIVSGDKSLKTETDNISLYEFLPVDKVINAEIGTLECIANDTLSYKRFSEVTGLDVSFVSEYNTRILKFYRETSFKGLAEKSDRNDTILIFDSVGNITEQIKDNKLTLESLDSTFHELFSNSAETEVPKESEEVEEKDNLLILICSAVATVVVVIAIICCIVHCVNKKNKSGRIGNDQSSE